MNPNRSRAAAVRIATEGDIAGLYWLLLRDLEADNSLAIPPSQKRVFEAVKRACTGDGGIAGVIEEPGKIVASVGLFATQHWFTDQWTITQLWLFVEPGARKGGALARQLFEFSLWHRSDMSRKFGYDVVLENSVFSRTRLPAKLRLWGRYGEMIGATFWNRGESRGQQASDDNHTENLAAVSEARLRRPRVQRAKSRQPAT